MSKNEARRFSRRENFVKIIPVQIHSNLIFIITIFNISKMILCIHLMTLLFHRVMNIHFEMCMIFFIYRTYRIKILIVTNCSFCRCQSPLRLSAKSIGKLAETHREVIRSAAGL